MNKKIFGLIAAIIVVFVSVAAFLASSSLISTQQPTGELDFTISASSDCLRFLNSNNLCTLHNIS